MNPKEEYLIGCDPFSSKGPESKGSKWHYHILKVKNFSAQLPDDLGWVVSIQDMGGRCVQCGSNRPISIRHMFPERINPQYTLDLINHRVLFSGWCSKWWIKRMWQKFWELFFPKLFLLTYIPSQYLKAEDFV